MVQQHDTWLKAYEKKRSLICPIIKTTMPQWQLESHLLSIYAPKTLFSLFLIKPQQLSLVQCLVIDVWQSLLVFPPGASQSS